MLWIILALFALLFFLTKHFSQTLYNLIYALTHSRTFPISILALIFFPGIVVHELSHWITAELIRVRTGEITLYPVIEEHGGVRLGSVAIERTDPFRRLTVGLAPIILGIVLLASLTLVWKQYLGSTLNVDLASVLTLNPNWAAVQKLLSSPFTYGYIYASFVIGSTMYSSKKDLEGFAVVAGIAIFIAIVLYFADLLPSGKGIGEKIHAQLELILLPLSIAVIINLVFLGLFKGLLGLIRARK